MKVLLVTLFGEFNFGNRLQHYALQNVIESCGGKVDSAINEYNTDLKEKAKGTIKYILGSVGVGKHKLWLKRKKKFRSFNCRYIKRFVTLDYREGNKELLSEKTQIYDKVIVGSDQVWHHWRSANADELPYFYLSFIPQKKRISYAASFGFEKFGDDIEAHRKGLSGMNRISVREDTMPKMIKELCGRDSKVTLDPVLLLDIEKWEQIQKIPDFSVPTKYILSYFLDDDQIRTSKVADRVIQEIKENDNDAKDCEIVRLTDYSFPQYYSVSPDEFIYLIHNAKYILTDSFHAVAFSILFNKEFYVSKRLDENGRSMFGRIETLLGKLNICDHVIVDMIDFTKKIDYQMVNDRLQMERKDSIKWLMDALLED